MRKGLFILGMLDDRDIDWIAAAGRRKQCLPGENLITEGQHPDAIFLVLDGELSIFIPSNAQPVAVARKGEILGELSLVDSNPASATVKAANNAVVLALSRQDIFNKIEDDPRFGTRFYRTLAIFLADRLRRAERSARRKANSEDPDATGGDEIEPELLDKVALAAARFNWIMNRLSK